MQNIKKSSPHSFSFAPAARREFTEGIQRRCREGVVFSNCQSVKIAPCVRCSFQPCSERVWLYASKENPLLSWCKCNLFFLLVSFVFLYPCVTRIKVSNTKITSISIFHLLGLFPLTHTDWWLCSLEHTLKFSSMHTKQDSIVGRPTLLPQMAGRHKASQRSQIKQVGMSALWANSAANHRSQEDWF